MKWERAWKSPHLRKVRCGGEREKWLHLTSASSLFWHGVIFMHTRVSLALLSLRKKGDYSESIIVNLFKKLDKSSLHFFHIKELFILKEARKVPILNATCAWKLTFCHQVFLCFDGVAMCCWGRQLLIFYAHNYLTWRWVFTWNPLFTLSKL